MSGFTLSSLTVSAMIGIEMTLFLVDVMVSSAWVGARKPHRRMYDAVLERAIRGLTALVAAYLAARAGDERSDPGGSKE